MLLETMEDTSINFKGYWELNPVRLKMIFPQLSLDELHYIPGEEEDLIRRLGLLLNKSYDEIMSIIISCNSQ